MASCDNVMRSETGLIMVSSPLVNVSAAEAPTHHHTVPQPHCGVAMPGLGEISHLSPDTGSTFCTVYK